MMALGMFASLDDLLAAACSDRFRVDSDYQPKTLAKINGATIVASDSMMNFGVSIFSLPQVIFSLGTAPEYDPKLVVESLI
jgi:CTP:molybdopterin cytidylyltransferase MocA